MITKKAKYALKALLYLSKKDKSKPTLIDEISKKEGIPKKFLEVILLELKNAGILGSKKGKGGGYYMIKPPDVVNMAEVLRLFDGPIAVVPCVSENYYEPCAECMDEATCSIREVFLNIRKYSVATLKENSFATLISRERKLKRDNN